MEDRSKKLSGAVVTGPHRTILDDDFIKKIKEKLQKKGGINSPEVNFMKACKSGNLKTVNDMLAAKRRAFDINFRDQRGQTALHYSIRNEQEDIFERLLQEPFIELNDALHCAVDTINVSAAQKLLHRGADPNQVAKTHVYPACSTPLMLACRKNSIDLIQLLLDFKAKKLILPDLTGGTLRQSRFRLDMIRSLISPAYVVITSQDPVMTAFEMSQLCRLMQNAEVEFAGEYKELELQCEKLAADLVDAVDSSDDIMVLLSLKKKRGIVMVGEPLTRLHYALEHQHKLFVAHSHCQQALVDKFFEGFSNWRHNSMFEKSFTLLSLIFLSPIWLIVYLFSPPTKLDVYLELPLMKFTANLVCYNVLLAVLIGMQINFTSFPSDSTSEAKIEAANKLMEQFPKGDEIEWEEIFIISWVLGKVWDECKGIKSTGIKSFIKDFWNLLDFVMNSVFICAFAARIIDRYKTTETGNSQIRQSFFWKSSNPLFVYESLRGIGSLLAFIRCIWWFRASQNLGKLQMMLGASFIDIFKFFFLFILVFLSFAGSMNAVFWKEMLLGALICKLDTSKSEFKDYIGECSAALKDRVENNDLPYISIIDCFYQLYWTLFGYSTSSNTNAVFATATLNELVGQALWIFYNFVAKVVILNVLVGMITKTLDNIESNIDVEWKFVRSQLYAKFIEDEECSPPPFNIFPSVRKMIKYVALFIYRFTKNQKYLLWAKPKQGKILKMRAEMEKRYEVLLEEMRERYLRDMEHEDKSKAVTQDDINNLKNDISSLRFELMDMLRKQEELQTQKMKEMRDAVTRKGNASEKIQKEDRELLKKMSRVLEMNCKITSRLSNNSSTASSTSIALK